MSLPTYRFTSDALTEGNKASLDADELGCLPATPNLERASLQNAALFGGPAVARCLEAAPIVGDKKYVFVDTKVSLLLAGFIPAIPGWHTDGVPRAAADPTSTDPYSPFNPGPPSLAMQKSMDDSGYFPRFHTIHVGNHCPTQFLIAKHFDLALEHSEDPGLYSEITALTNDWLSREDSWKIATAADAPHSRWLSWDWWQIHRAQPAKQRGWRLLIRITESSEPPKDRDFIRSQTQVYVPEEFGW